MNNSSYRVSPQSNSGQKPSNPISYLFILMIIGAKVLSLKGDNKRQNKAVFAVRFIRFCLDCL
jgi:hypothetical protein